MGNRGASHIRTLGLLVYGPVDCGQIRRELRGGSIGMRGPCLGGVMLRTNPSFGGARCRERAFLVRA